MKFKRITENQSYEHIVLATQYLRDNGFFDIEVREHEQIKELNLDLNQTTTPGVGVSGEGEYSGTIVTNSNGGYRVISIYIDVLCPKQTAITDITESLGELDPSHKRCDIRKPVSMAIIYWLEQFGTVPKNVLRYSRGS
jgi:hypothetical protein